MDIITHKKCGSLRLIIGPMFSGKSTELIKRAGRLKSIGKKILTVVHQIDDRYGKGMISTHNGNHWFENVTISDKLSEIDVREYDVVIVEELQFFEDAFSNIVSWVDEIGIDVICAGLDGDFKRSAFGDVLKLIPYADEILRLSALCKLCGDGTEAHFSKRIIKSDDKVVVGGASSYEAVCRKHYLID